MSFVAFILFVLFSVASPASVTLDSERAIRVTHPIYFRTEPLSLDLLFDELDLVFGGSARIANDEPLQLRT